MKAELAQLIALQNADTNIRTLQAEIESIPQRRAEIEKEFDQRAFEIRALEERRDTAFHERSRVEKEIFEQKQRAERADRNLMAAKKPDEYTAAIREADAARKQNGACMACYMSLRPQIMADVRRGAEIITCDNCNRILYYAPDKKAAHPLGV